MSGEALAEVSNCIALTLIGNAARQGICIDVSDPKPLGIKAKSVVCELEKTSNLDVHLTITKPWDSDVVGRNKTPVHLTVENKHAVYDGNVGCRDKGELSYSLLKGFSIDKDKICEIRTSTYIEKLNGVDERKPNGVKRSCSDAFIDANRPLRGNADAISAHSVTYYKELCKKHCGE
jgi:hypothetical protein